MAGVDQILSVVVQQGANELRLGTDQEPQVLAKGARRRFTMSPTPNEVLRQLLGDILSPERELALSQGQRLVFDYERSGMGNFQVRLTPRAGGAMDVVFLRTERLEATADAAVPTPARSTYSPASKAESTFSPLAAPTHAVETPPFEVAALFLEFVERAVQARASDIHLADGESPWLRIDGQLQPLADTPALAVAELFGLDVEVKTKVLGGAALEFGITVPSQRRLRVSLYRMQAGLAAAVRLLPATAPALNELNLPVSLQGLAELPHGLVLVCGATGSGKSTTLAALSRHAVESRSIVLVTLEDPIEFSLVGNRQSLVRQRQIGRDLPNFTAGLRDALRSDPDVIVVGELRDPETIRLALTAAETGHLVLASIHSGSAAACVERVVDAYPSEQRSQIRVQLANALRAVVVQKLVPRARGNGRVPAVEVLRVTHAVGNVIREGKTAQIGTLLQAGKRDGMISLDRCLAEYCQAGIISTDQAKAWANDADSLMMYLTQ